VHFKFVGKKKGKRTLFLGLRH